MQRIHYLSSLLADQIAAGEVVERPASVVKELIENSLDAGATDIQIDLKQGGLQWIRVRDNGSGIHPEDLPLSLARHATSKIRELNDLSRIVSLGFRGEAMASISSVSRMRIASRQTEQPHGWEIQAEGTTQISSAQPCAHPVGTTVEVSDLFFNTPARRRFMRSERSEFLSIDDLLRRLALSSMSCAFRWTHQGRDVMRLLPAQNLEQQTQRVAHVLNQEFIQNSVFIDQEGTGMRLWGWIGLPTFSRSHADFQYWYLNGRWVKDRLLMQTARQMFQENLKLGRHPGFVLFLEMDPTEVDVNVHPTKHEVRFHKVRWVQDFILQTLSRAIHAQAYIAPSKEEKSNFSPTSFQTTEIDAGESFGALGIYRGLLHQRYGIFETPLGFRLVDGYAVFRYGMVQRWMTLFKQQKLKTIPIFQVHSYPISTEQYNVLQSFEKRFSDIGFAWKYENGKLTLLNIPPFFIGFDLSYLIIQLVTTVGELSQINSKADELQCMETLGLLLPHSVTSEHLEYFHEVSTPEVLMSMIEWGWVKDYELSELLLI